MVTFCRSAVTPVAAEEGLTGQLSVQRKDAIHCQAGWVEFTDEEVLWNTIITSAAVSIYIQIQWT